MSESGGNERIVVDPITRIEGHLRIEAQMNGNKIEKAYSSGTMVRGIETILKGRDPRDAWAFAQRICGVCTLVHGLASIRSVEDALDYKIPKNADLIRNLMSGAQYIHDHVMHFYHLHALDWVDVVSALSADPKATAALAQSLSSYPRSSEGYFRDVQKKVRDFVEAGQLGIFAKAYWGHPEYKLPAEANLMAVAHYLDALEWQRDVARLHTIFGGKNPHPNFVVGGVPCPIDLNSDSAINAKKLSQVQDIINQLMIFVDQVYVDLAGGTGDIAALLSKRVGANGHVVLSDINEAMLNVGRQRLEDQGIVGNLSYAIANAEYLPFDSGEFDAVTIAFGLRNVTDKDAALREMYRVLRPGGKALILEFSKVQAEPLKAIYDTWSFGALPILGKLIADDEDSYRYLAESIRMHPDQETLRDMMEQAGFERCDYHNLTGGVVAIHRGFKL